MYVNGLDIETYGRGDIQPYCICISYRGFKQYSYGLNCIKLSIDWIFDNCVDKSVFFAHNLTFDGGLILNYMGSSYNIISTGTLLRGGNIYALCITKGYKKIFFKCSAKFLPMELGEIAKKLNISEKLEFNHDIVDVDIIKDISFKNSAVNYCYRDVKILISFMYRLNTSVSKFLPYWWLWTYSISGLSIKIFDRKFNDNRIKLSIKKDIDDLVRPSYYGGRCEVFGNPRKNDRIFHYDFSGMYTNRLKEAFPIDDFKMNKCVYSISKPGFYMVHVKSFLKIPILPFRDNESKKLIFPNGFFSGLYWWEELKLFEEKGGIITKIEYCLEFNEIGYPFKDFGEKCDEFRKNSAMDKIFWKLIPNSFVGRMGLKNDFEETKIIDDCDYNPINLNVISDKKINNKWVVRIKSTGISDNLNSNVIYPSIVTSKARVLWWKSAEDVVKNGGRLLYCDTDSIFASFKKDVSNERHGDVYWDTSKEDTIISDACFATSKVYCIEYKGKKEIKMKGISKKNIKNLGLVEFKELFLKNKKKSIKTTLFDKNFLDMKISEIEKIIDFGGYDKRIFNKKKDDTKPLVINILPYVK